MTKLVSKYIITGQLTNTSPLLIGKGEGELIDKEIAKDNNGIPYIPATSFVGAVKHYLSESDLSDKREFHFLFGSDGDSTNHRFQSHFIIDDLYPDDTVSTLIRDGIKIGTKGVVEEKKKFNYEVLEPGSVFKLFGEIKIFEEFNKNEIETILATLFNSLKKERIRFGAFTTKGFGKIKLKYVEVYQFNFPKDGDDYLKYLQDPAYLPKEKRINLSGDISKNLHENMFMLKGKFDIKNSLIIGGGDADDSDKSHIKSVNRNILTATSLKGALKTRAEAIMSIIGNKGKEIIDNLFGYGDELNKISKKGRLMIEETEIESKEEIHHRIKIDRFTGGAMEGALFDSKPLWYGEVNIKLEILEPKDYEIGLVLLLLKDLWTGDLPLGGEKSIGRGVLRGIDAELSLNGDKWFVREDKDNNILHIEGNKEKLEKFVESLNRYPVEGGCNG